jgi:predicted transposase/invertase (TIGR01784 family)
LFDQLAQCYSRFAATDRVGGVYESFSYKDFEDDKLICVDVKATDRAGRVFIVEVQIVVHPSFAKRAVYYACKGYSDQLQAGQGYSKLKATYSVCLLMRELWEDERLHHQFQLVERATGKVLEDSIEIHIVELSKYNKYSRSCAVAIKCSGAMVLLDQVLK